MEIIPQAWLAKQFIDMLSLLSSTCIAIFSLTLKRKVREAGRAQASYLLTFWLGVLTASIHLMILCEANLGSHGTNKVGRKMLAKWKMFATFAFSAVWSAQVAVLMSKTWDCDLNPTLCGKTGLLCGLSWLQSLFLAIRLLLVAVENYTVGFQQMLQVARKKLGPWYEMVKNPFVQILSSVGVLLSGLGASVGLLLTGVTGLLDGALGLIGLGDLRQKLMTGLGLNKVLDSVDKFFTKGTIGPMGAAKPDIASSPMDQASGSIANVQNTFTGRGASPDHKGKTD